MRFTHHQRHMARSRDWVFNPEWVYEQPVTNHKPRGLWLSVDDDWRRWAEDGGLGWVGDDGVEFDVDLDRCVVVSSVDELDRFHDQWYQDWRQQPRYRSGIRWAAVAQQYSGIVIAPYLQQRRLDGAASDWYYPWDCASGCVWDLTAVRAKERV